MNQTNRQEISQQEYDKKVTSAMAHYEYFDRMKREEAMRKASQEVAKEYVVLNK